MNAADIDAAVTRLRLTTLIGADVPDRADILVCDAVPAGHPCLPATAVEVGCDQHLDDGTPGGALVGSAIPVLLRNVPASVARWVYQRAGRRFLLDLWQRAPVATPMPGGVLWWTFWIFTAHPAAERAPGFAAGPVADVRGYMTRDVHGRFHTMRPHAGEMPTPTV